MKTILQSGLAYGRCATTLIERWFAPVADLVARLYLARVFFSSGLTKLDDWDITIALFTDEYRTPLLPPEAAAVLGTAGELFFPVLLALGLAGRIGAIGLFGVNIMAVVSYWHVLGLPEQAASLTHHLNWGLLLALLIGHGPGKLSVDALILRIWPGLLDKSACGTSR
ncbi:DoxX family protein [Chitinimonas arctica]|uniref:DoxX family protein n=1 Tax=Chitinimonas arctica TaxID=2594795 RepID=A0A516SGN3_9NEIS|nr:DoxX family protein [Chitinimonas arctica]QDQ27315.1 DoxX family protein [Chitinimonas arctica]